MSFESIEMPVAGYSVFIDSIEIECSLPFSLIDGYIVKKADDEQIIRIKENINKFCASPLPYEYYYEYASIKTEPGVRFEKQDKEKWRYYIIDHYDNGSALFDLQLASNITDLPLDFSSLRLRNGGRGYSPNKLHSHFQEMDPELKVVRQHNFEEISNIYKSIIEVAGGSGKDGPFPELRRALQMYDNLKSLPYYSDFYIIGLFAIIEMLVTHNPKLEDRGDSITHQMRSKIPLLSKRFENKVETSTFFGDTLENKIWTHLYKYRSSLAHGGVPDFEKDLKALRDFKNVKEFLDLIVRRMLNHSLQEPLLYRDLREC